MSTEPATTSLVTEIEWMTTALQAGFEPGEPVDGVLLDRLVDHLNGVKRFAELLEGELATSRELLKQVEKRTRTSAASLHPQPGKMQ